MDENLVCKVEKVTSSQEGWKILEAKFGTKESGMQQQVMSQSLEESIENSVADLRVDEKDSRRTIELGESHLKVDDGHEDNKSETHHVNMHMDEEDVANIIEIETEASVCEAEQEHIHVDGETHCDGTHVDYFCKMRRELVNLAEVNEFGEVEIFNVHMHAQISQHRVDENYVNDICGIFFETGTSLENIESAMYDEELKVEVPIIPTIYEAKVGTTHE